MKKLIVPLAEGLEEIEAVSIIDILRRAEIEVTTAGLDSTRILGSHKITIEADELLEDLKPNNYDGIVLPGGMPGTLNLKNNPLIISVLQNFFDAGKLIGAICAAPMVLYEAGILEGKDFTMHPGVKDEIPLEAKNVQVVEDGNMVTGQASGAAVLFALTIVKKLQGQKKMDEVNQGVLYKI
jgi:4-methyl-5(b-hydroxyethyl)-thiazole monophosphate biosynthesis